TGRRRHTPPATSVRRIAGMTMNGACRLRIPPMSASAGPLCTRTWVPAPFVRGPSTVAAVVIVRASVRCASSEEEAAPAAEGVVAFDDPHGVDRARDAVGDADQALEREREAADELRELPEEARRDEDDVVRADLDVRGRVAEVDHLAE